SDLCGPRGGGPSLLRGLSRRRAMGRGRSGEGLVRPGEVPAGVPRRPVRPNPRDAAGGALRGSGFLTGDKLKRALLARAAELGFDAVRITRPDAIPTAPSRLESWLAEQHHGPMAWMAAAPDRRAD